MICIAVALCGTFVALGLAITVTSVRALREGWLSARWPQTTATVVDAEQTEDDSKDTVTVKVAVRYTYTVGGVAHEGTGIHPTYSGSSDRRLEGDLLALLRPGATVRVYYRPEAPARSYLTAGFLSGPLALFFAGLVFLVGGVGFGLIVAEEELVGRNPNEGVGLAVLVVGAPLCMGLCLWFFLFGNRNYAARVHVVESASVGEVQQ